MQTHAWLSHKMPLQYATGATGGRGRRFSELREIR